MEANSPGMIDASLHPRPSGQLGAGKRLLLEDADAYSRSPGLMVVVVMVVRQADGGSSRVLVVVVVQGGEHPRGGRRRVVLASPGGRRVHRIQLDGSGQAQRRRPWGRGRRVPALHL